jgi:hypothetical protein
MDVFYGKAYDSKDMFLMEVPLSYLEDIKNSKDDLKIKGNENLSVLSTESRTYELKYVYTTNSFFLLENGSEEKKMSVTKVSDHTLELSEYIPRKSVVYKMLRSNALKANKFNGGTNYSSNL